MVAFFAYGEGWHNYHHTFPWDYRGAELNSHICNFNLTVINYFARLGWVYDLKQAPQSMVQKWAQKYGDGTHSVYGAECAEIKMKPDNCAVTDLEAFKNIQNKYTATDEDSNNNNKNNEKQSLKTSKVTLHKKTVSEQ